MGSATHIYGRRLTAEIVEPLRQALPVDGVMLSLHGAFCAEEEGWVEDDADGYILRAVRGEHA